MVFTEQLVRRGMRFAHDCIKRRPGEAMPISSFSADRMAEKNPWERMLERFTDPGAVIILVLTFLAFFVVSYMIQYSIRVLATVLAIVEDTDGQDVSDMSKTGLLVEIDGQKTTLIETTPVVERTYTPITAKLRTTFAHLQSQGGFKAGFRGLGYGIFYAVIYALFSIILTVAFSAFLGLTVGSFIGHILAGIACCNLHATWTHAIIADQTEQKSFFKSFLPVSTAKKLVLPTVRFYLSASLPQVLLSSGLARAVPFQILVLLTIFIVFGLVLPAYIALTRVEAAYLPEDMNPIVPFERTFGGRLNSLFIEVMPEESSSERRCRFRKFRQLSFRGAYLTFDKVVYKRVLARFAQYFGLSTLAFISFAFVFAAELYVIVGGCHEIKKVIEWLDQQPAGELPWQRM